MVNMGIIKAKIAKTAKDIRGVILRWFVFLAKIITSNQNYILNSATISFVSNSIIYTLSPKMYK